MGDRNDGGQSMEMPEHDTFVWNTNQTQGGRTPTPHRDFGAHTDGAMPGVGGVPPLPPTMPAQGETFVWGTGISVERFRADAQDYFETHRGPADDAPHFRQVLQRLQVTGGRTVEIDCCALTEHRPVLFQQLVNAPSECLQLLGDVATQLYRALVPNAEEVSLVAAAVNMPERVSLRRLGPAHVETLVAVEGMVVRASRLLPELRVARFRCWVCGEIETSVVEGGRIFEPPRCPSCAEAFSHELQHNRSMYDDKQVVRLQEAPEFLAEGETPVTLSIVVYGALADTVVPGDRIVVTGIYRSTPLKLNPNARAIRAVFRTMVDAVSIVKKSAQDLMAAGGAAASPFGAPPAACDELDEPEVDPNDPAMAAAGAALLDEHHQPPSAVVPDPSGPVDGADAERATLFRLARLPDLRQVLVRSLAPSIFGHDAVKLGLLCQLFGGCRKDWGGGGGTRSEIHVLLCGDPGVAKSQLLTRMHKVAPRGVYTSGKGSSSVGLTAFVTKDADTGEFVLEPGALVLGDRGLCCIDELDKMDDGARAVLHEVLEQQTLSIAKAGIIAQLNARTALLAAANPKESQWNPALTIVENLQVEPTLMSRFDLIFLLLDTADEAADRRLAAHILDLYRPSAGPAGPDVAAGAAPLPDHEWLEAGRVLPPRRFSQYVAAARAMAHPRLSDEATASLKAGWVAMRRGRGDGRVTATLRQLESTVRLAEAIARMRFSSAVTRDDAVEAQELVRTALQEAATDPRTGLIRLDMFAAAGPNSSTPAACVPKLADIIAQRFIAHGRRQAPVAELRAALNDALPRPLPPHAFMDVLALLQGGDALHSFTATTATFAVPEGVGR